MRLSDVIRGSSKADETYWEPAAHISKERNWWNSFSFRLCVISVVSTVLLPSTESERSPSASLWAEQRAGQCWVQQCTCYTLTLWRCERQTVKLCVKKQGSSICPVWGNVLISTLMKTTIISFYRAFLKAGSWFGYLSVKNRNSLNHAVKWSSRLLGEPQQSPCTSYCDWLLWFNPLSV